MLSSAKAPSSSLISPSMLIISIRLILIMVKLIWNPNIYSSLLGLIWSLVSFRWGTEMLAIVAHSISILSGAGLGMAMFSLGLFMALQPKIIACGNSVAAFSMAMVDVPMAMMIKKGIAGKLLERKNFHMASCKQTTKGMLSCRDISYNQIPGEIPYNIGFLQVATLSLQGNRLREDPSPRGDWSHVGSSSFGTYNIQILFCCSVIKHVYL